MTLLTLAFPTFSDFAKAVAKQSPPTLEHEAFDPIDFGDSVVVDVRLPFARNEFWRLRGKKVSDLPPQVQFGGGQEATWEYLLSLGGREVKTMYQRRFGRVPFSVPVSFQMAGESDQDMAGSGMTTDISVGGLALTSENTLPAGATVELSVAIGPRESVALRGRVVWRRDDAHALGAGIRFDDLGGAGSKRLRQVLYDVALTGNYASYERAAAQWHNG